MNTFRTKPIWVLNSWWKSASDLGKVDLWTKTIYMDFYEQIINGLNEPKKIANMKKIWLCKEKLGSRHQPAGGLKSLYQTIGWRYASGEIVVLFQIQTPDGEKRIHNGNNNRTRRSSTHQEHISPSRAKVESRRRSYCLTDSMKTIAAVQYPAVGFLS